MKRISLLLILLMLGILTGCVKNRANIKPTEIFIQNHKHYYVYFYGSTCEVCKQLDPLIKKYLKASRQKKDDDFPIMYQINVESLPPYYVNPNWESDIIGSNNVFDLKIGSVPTILLIRNKRVHLVISGGEDIDNLLNNLLGKM